MATVAALEETMNAQGLAAHLGVTERTVRRWIERGSLPAEKRGGTFVIRREDGERARFSALGAQIGDQRRELEIELARVREELSELRGRYAAAAERLAEVERSYDNERRRSARLELELELAQSQNPLRVA